MRLIYLHGPPASGKTTVATALAARTGWALLDNHVTIDAARVVAPFGTPSFWAVVAGLRLTLVTAAARVGAVDALIVTSCYDHPADLPTYRRLEAAVRAAGGTVCPVYLRAPVAELERRVINPDRAARGELASVTGLRAALARWSCVPVPSADVVTLSTARRTPAAVVTALLRRLGDDPPTEPPRTEPRTEPPTEAGR